MKADNMTDKIQSKDGYQVVIFELTYLPDELRKRGFLFWFSVVVWMLGFFGFVFLNEYTLFMYSVPNLSQKVQSGNCLFLIKTQNIFKSVYAVLFPTICCKSLKENVSL